VVDLVALVGVALAVALALAGAALTLGVALAGVALVGVALAVVVVLLGVAFSAAAFFAGVALAVVALIVVLALVGVALVAVVALGRAGGATPAVVPAGVRDGALAARLAVVWPAGSVLVRCALAVRPPGSVVLAGSALPAGSFGTCPTAAGVGWSGGRRTAGTVGSTKSAAGARLTDLVSFCPPTSPRGSAGVSRVLRPVRSSSMRQEPSHLSPWSLPAAVVTWSDARLSSIVALPGSVCSLYPQPAAVLTSAWEASPSLVYGAALLMRLGS
jgi:hypothetical protein